MTQKEIQWTEVGDGEMNQSWPPKGEELKEGSSIEGRYVNKKENVGKNKSNVYTLEHDDGSKTDVWGGTVIDARMEEVAIGKMVKIVYRGEKPSKNYSNPYKDYGIFYGINDASENEGQKFQ